MGTEQSTTRSNTIPFRPSERDAVYDVIDGERDYQIAGEGNAARAADAPELSIGDFILLMERYVAAAREEGVHGAAGNIQALPDIRKVVALGVHALEVYGAPPREWHVPVSASVTGELKIEDLGDKTRPGAPRPNLSGL